jgi:hypothetical protein
MYDTQSRSRQYHAQLAFFKRIKQVAAVRRPHGSRGVCGGVSARFCGRASGPVRSGSPRWSQRCIGHTVHARAACGVVGACGGVWLWCCVARAAEKGGSPRAGRPPGRARAATRTTPTQGLVTPNAPSRQPRTARRASRSQSGGRRGRAPTSRLARGPPTIRATPLASCAPMCAPRRRHMPGEGL